jgi:hypothetical protein
MTVRWNPTNRSPRAEPPEEFARSRVAVDPSTGSVWEVNVGTPFVPASPSP